MKKLVFIGFLGLSLTGCGGGSDSTYVPIDKDNNGNGGSHNAEIQGVYSGSTSQGQSVTGIIEKNNKFWFLYTPPYQNVVSGFMSGDLKVTGKVAQTTNGKDYYFAGATSSNTSIMANAETKKSLNGTIAYSGMNQVTFNTTYDASLSESSAKLSDIVGTYNGTSAIVQGVEKATVSITSNGEISGRGISGCTFTGKATTIPGAAYFKLDLLFGYSQCYMAGQAVSGIIYYNKTNRAFYAAAENSSRQNAVLFLATK
ncbi:hypothetical protein F895_01956 [Acinetobacter sp. CIP 64.2]|uniref:hypothetical protein n=1 Tax=unclassified Acinetobacter TaxID=196816 RepID=UPI0002888C58|nr:MULTISPECIES: hypothetical protein [unclassified Acinetobacter]ENX15410.1 hypothetical protein F895_01956 [Acinetobacter sp. CIP 64.2]